MEQPQSLEEIKAANDAKDRFFAFLSHELRTPLTPVLAALSSPEFVRAVPLSLQHILDMVRHNVELEARLIDDLLDVTRISHGKVELRPESIDLHNVIRLVADSFADEIRRARLTLELHLDATHCTARADAVRLQQIFSNLLKNAIKFTPVGGKITIRSADAPDDKITITFQDNGVGIQPNQLQRLFQPFEQMQMSSTGPTGGLGLGLPIARGLVEAHGGKIDAHSPGLGKGTTFQVTLPLSPSSQSAAPNDAPHTTPPSAAAPKAAKPASAHAMPLRILLVEDHADTAEVMAHLLRHEGHDVVIAFSAHEALMLASEPFDVIVSDLGLPDGSGLDVMRAFSSSQDRIHGIALSGFAATDDIRQSFDAGFDEHLCKPVSFPILLTAIAQITKKSPAPSQA